MLIRMRMYQTVCVICTQDFTELKCIIYAATLEESCVLLPLKGLPCTAPLRELHFALINVIGLKCNNTDVAEYDHLLPAYLQLCIYYESANLCATLHLYTPWTCLGCGLLLTVKTDFIGLSIIVHAQNVHHCSLKLHFNYHYTL